MNNKTDMSKRVKRQTGRASGTCLSSATAAINSPVDSQAGGDVNATGKLPPGSPIPFNGKTPDGQPLAVHASQATSWPENQNSNAGPGQTDQAAQENARPEQTDSDGAESGSSSRIGAKDIFCSQINLHHCSTAALAINEWFAKSLDAKIALIQEPYLIRGKIQGLQNNLKIYRGSQGPKIRACIATSNNIEAWLLTQYSNQDQTAIGIRMGGDILIVASTYMPYDSIDPPPPKILEELTLFCKEKKWSLIVGADANSHNTVWGSTDTNQRGDKLLDFILSSDLQICNVGDKPTFSNAVREEVIDLTLATIEIERKVMDWKVSEEESFSDHNRIEFILRMNYTPTSTSYRNVRKTDWQLYREELLGRTSWEIEESDSLEEITQRLTDSVQESFHVSCKLTMCKKGRKPPWWNNSLGILKREAMRWKRRFRRNPSDENKTEKKNALRQYTKEVHRAKRDHWKIFCQEMMTLSATGRISRILKSGVQQRIGTVKDASGKSSDTPDETLKILLDSHFPSAEEGGGGEEVMEMPQATDAQNVAERVINREALRAALNSFQPYKAPGPDGIYPILIQKGLDIIEDKLMYLYKKSLLEGRPPRQWNETRVVFIPKPGKPDYTDPKAYRPLSLNSFLHKGEERMVLWDILGTTELDTPMHKNLYSYMEGKSTEDALHLVVHKIEKAINSKKVAVAVFLDIDSAFSNATFSSMEEALKNKGIDKTLQKWIVNSLINREAVATQDSFSVKKNIEKGCPQGGILSPYIWNLIMDDLLGMFPKIHPTEVVCYADDVMLLGVGIDEDMIVRNLRRDMIKLEEWAEKHRLNFSPHKTKMILFSRRRIKVKPILRLKKTPIEWVESLISWSHLRQQTRVEPTY